MYVSFFPRARVRGSESVVRLFFRDRFGGGAVLSALLRRMIGMFRILGLLDLCIIRSSVNLNHQPLSDFLPVLVYEK